MTTREKLTKLIPIPKFDKLQHYFTVRYLSIPIGLWGLAQPLFAFIALNIVFAIAIGWEVPKLIKNKFSKQSISDALGDILMAALAGGVIWLYLFFKL